MTDDLRRTEDALRTLLAGRAAEMAPVDLHADVLRTARRRRTVVAAGVAAALVAAGVPTALAAATRPDPAVPGSAPAAAAPCDPATTPTARPGDPSAPPGGRSAPPADPDPAFPPQTDVRGSLGGDGALVRAVLRVGWTRIRTWAPLWENDRVVARTARVLYVERVGGMIVAGMTAGDGTGPLDVDDARTVAQVYVVGRDASSLVAFRAGGWNVTGEGTGSPVPGGNQEVLSDTQPVAGVTVCGTGYAVVRARPGSAATLRWATALEPDGSPRYASAPVPLADGFGILRLPSSVTDVTVTGGGTGPVTRRVHDYDPDPAPLFPADQVTVAVQAAGSSDERVVRAAGAAIGAGAEDSRGLPVSDLRVLGVLRSGDSTGVLVSWALSGGLRYVSAWSAVSGPGVSVGTAFRGLLPADELDRTVFAWRLRQEGPGNTVRPLAVVTLLGVRAEVVRGQDVQSVALTDGAAVLPDGTGVTEVRAYDADGRLIARAVPDRGLLRPKD
jgi:hypothetical protein